MMIKFIFVFVIGHPNETKIGKYHVEDIKLVVHSHESQDDGPRESTDSQTDLSVIDESVNRNRRGYHDAAPEKHWAD
jgi:hypothetical protein